MTVMRRGYFLLPVLLLMLTGCYRQASDPFDTVAQPLPNTAAPTTELEFDDPLAEDDLDDVELPDEVDLDDDAGTGSEPLEIPDDEDISAEGAPTFPPVTMIESTPIVPPTQAPPDIDTAGPADQVDTGASEPVPVMSPSPTVTRITPAAPSGPSAISTIPPTATPDAEVTATPSGLITPTSMVEIQDHECIYVVRSGDNLFRIAINHDVTLAELRAANPQIRSDIIQPGDRLTIPNCQPETTTDDAPAPVEVAPPIEAPPLGDQGIVSPGTQTVHVVQSGETLGSIARRYNVTINSIVQANNLANPNQLSVGQELIIPGS
jgi:LysM repeat protein